MCKSEMAQPRRLVVKVLRDAQAAPGWCCRLDRGDQQWFKCHRHFREPGLLRSINVLPAPLLFRLLIHPPRTFSTRKRSHEEAESKKVELSWRTGLPTPLSHSEWPSDVIPMLRPSENVLLLNHKQTR